MKTCGLCAGDEENGHNSTQCKDTMKGCKTKKKKGKCEEEEIANKCRKTCGLCDQTITTSKGNSKLLKTIQNTKIISPCIIIQD